MGSAENFSFTVLKMSLKVELKLHSLTIQMTQMDVNFRCSLF